MRVGHAPDVLRALSRVVRLGIAAGAASGCMVLLDDGGYSTNGAGVAASGQGGNFTGAPWTGTETVMIICSFANGTTNTTTTTNPLALTLFASGSGIAYTDPSGCTFSFTVSGSTATLSNVACPVALDASTTETTFTNYTLSTPDGHSLTLSASGKETGSTRCGSGMETFLIEGGATR